MRKISAIVLHAAHTPPDMDVGVEEIRRWHVEERGWDDVGYHYVITRVGEIQEGRLLEDVGAHVYGHNDHTIGICLVGGRAPDSDQPDTNFTRLQWRALELLVEQLQQEIGGLEVRGHRDYDDSKACPTFDAHKWWHGAL